MISNDLLKKKVLDLAIHGKLVENDLNLSPVDVDSVVDDVPFEIPANWKWTSLSNIFEVKGGKRIPKGASFIDNGEHVYIRVADMENMTINTSNLKYIDDETHEAIKRYIITDKDLYITVAGTIGQVGSVPIELSGMNLTENANRLIPREVDKEFYKYILNGDFMQDSIKDNTTKAAQPKLAIKRINDLIIPVPPLEEQHKIVEKIEELFLLIDNKDKNDNEKSALKIILKDKILDSAIHGKLVENDLTLSPVSVEGITDDVPFEIPSNWKWAAIKDIVIINPRNYIDDELEVSFLPMTNICGGYLSKYNCENKKWKDVKSGFTHFMKNDVIIAKITPCFENRKSAHLVSLLNDYGAGTTELHVLRNEYGIMHMPYLLWFVKTQRFIDSGKGHFTGTAGQQRISKKWLEEVLIPIPPFDEQRKIVEKIEECFNLIDQL